MLIIVLRNALKAYGFTVFNADITLEERLFVFSFYFRVSLITTDVFKKKKTKTKHNQEVPCFLPTHKHMIVAKASSK